MEYKRIGFDLHVGGPHQLFKKWDKVLFQLDGLGGDCCDFTNEKKKNLPELLRLYNALKSHYGDWYTEGNHEQSHWEHLYKKWTSKSGKVCGLAHHIVWSEDEIQKWRERKDGAGIFRRFGSRCLNEFRDEFGGFSITDIEKERAFRFMQTHGIDMLALGHKHPLHIEVFSYNNMELRFYPRGIHVVAFD